MIRMRFSLALRYEVTTLGSDFIFNIHAAHTPRQAVINETLLINQNVRWTIDADPMTHNRYLRLSAISGPLEISYAATVDLRHYLADSTSVEEIPVAQLPAQVLTYLYPSRYCQSDRLYRLATREFGQRSSGYCRVQAILEWVKQRISYAQNTSDASSSAIDTLIETAGVCRDFAHLMIALCRASNIPARFTTGINYGVTPGYGALDFHAYVEVYLTGGWYIFDPSGASIPLGLIRFGTGRDAADVSFATIFGDVISFPPMINIEMIHNDTGRQDTSDFAPSALSTDTELFQETL